MSSIVRSSLNLIRTRRKHICDSNVAATILSCGLHHQNHVKIQDNWIPKKIPAEIIRRFSKQPCNLKTIEVKNSQSTENKRQQRHESSTPVGSSNQNCDTPGSADLLRLDDLFYRKSDDETREYQQTWTDHPYNTKQPKYHGSLDNPEPEAKDTEAKQECENVEGKSCATNNSEPPRKSSQPSSSPLNEIERRRKKSRPAFLSFSEGAFPRAALRRSIDYKSIPISGMWDSWLQFHYQTFDTLPRRLQNTQFNVHWETVNPLRVHFHNS